MSAETILVIDDAVETCVFIADLVLRPAGYQTLQATDGRAGLDLALNAAPDLVVTDLKLPGLDGLQLAERLQAAGRDLPIILVTAVGSEELARQALRVGVTDYLIKPFSADELLKAVRRALDVQQARRERQHMQTELAASHASLTRRLQELETLTVIGQSVSAMLDLDQVLARVVEAAVNLTGAEEGSLLLIDPATGDLFMRAARNFDDAFVRTFRLPSKDSLAGRVIRTGQPVLLDRSAPQKIKTSYLVRSLLYVPLQVQGRVIGVLGVDNRLSERRAFNDHDQRLLQALGAQAAIAIENAGLYARSETERVKLETILGGIEDAVVVVDPHGALVLVNPAARQALGLPADALAGRPLAEVIPHVELRELLAGEARRGELTLDDGRVYNVHLTPIPNVGRAAIMQDITHLKELDRIKSEFVTTVSHDLRSPLTAILGYVELIGRTGPVTEQQAEFIRRVQYSVQSITALVSDLLDLGRIEAGFDAGQEAILPGLVIQYAVDGLRLAVEAKRQTLAVSIPPDLPPLRANPPRLRQMLANLIDNAIRYTPEGGRIEVTARAEGGFLIIIVRDNGIGIPPAEQPYVFDKFYRAANARADTSGTGLGLSIVKSIVDAHHGRIWVDSTLKGGTTFSVMLPMAKEAK